MNNSTKQTKNNNVRSTCTCGAVPNTYLTAAAISSAFNVGMLFFFNNSSILSEKISVSTTPGLILYVIIAIKKIRFKMR